MYIKVVGFLINITTTMPYRWFTGASTVSDTNSWKYQFNLKNIGALNHFSRTIAIQSELLTKTQRKV